MPERALRGSLALGSRAESGRGAKGGDDGKQKEKKRKGGSLTWSGRFSSRTRGSTEAHSVPGLCFGEHAD